MRGLAYLNALKAFEAAARNGSYVAAARELNVTPAAVGQQVRVLEDWLGLTLFHRSNAGPTRLTLTERANEALPDLQAGFDRVAAALHRLSENNPSSRLTITATPAFVSKWLLPRIDDFQAAHPELELRLDVSERLIDLAKAGVDLAVRYGDGDWPGMVSEKLLNEEVFPVCSPALLTNGPPLRTADDLRGYDLIHDTSVSASGGEFPSWSDWLSAAGARGVDAERGLRINSSAAVIQAVIAGQGLGLCRSVLVDHDLRTRLLVRPFVLPTMQLNQGWHLVSLPSAATSPKVAALRSWLKKQGDLFEDANS
ncbi:LysR substrate-binding domain-containing protein [Aquidulcibacter sp.]|jgi:LysR family glycine cleavage system transcriptional activator|uniref:LysR substrate-binding domain-containing protein n=1 Tax=Aquidulcibacter sp. TaxID=2052990 RepID=UPI003BA6A8F1